MHYRDTTVWQKAMQAVDQLYKLAPRLPREETYGMRAQITRAAVSIPANIAEGWTPETQRDKAHFLAIAQGSLAETEALLTICERQGWLPVAETEALRGHLDEVSRILDDDAPQSPHSVTSLFSLLSPHFSFFPHSFPLAPPLPSLLCLRQGKCSNITAECAFLSTGSFP